MNATTPGLEIFSADWLREAAPTIPDPWRPVILEACRAFQLGNSTDPTLLYEILSTTLEPRHE